MQRELNHYPHNAYSSSMILLVYTFKKHAICRVIEHIIALLYDIDVYVYIMSNVQKGSLIVYVYIYVVGTRKGE